MGKTVYVCKATFEVAIDPAKPESVARAAEWMSKLASGTVVTPPDDLPLTIDVTSAPSIVNRRDDK